MQKSRAVKVYTTSEVIDEYEKILLSKEQEQEDLRFKLHGDKDGELNEELGIYKGRLMWLYSKESFEINKSTISYLWERIELPVGFMEAAEKAGKKGSEIRVEHKFTMGTYCANFHWLENIMCELARNLETANLADVIINGRWYVKY